MKTTIKKIAFIAITILFASEANAQWGNKKVVGNGNITTKTISTGDYDAIKASGSMDFVLMSGTEGTIKVTADDNFHEYIKIETKGDELIIKKKNGVYLKSRKAIKIEIPYTDISKVSLTGSGDLWNEGTLKASNFKTAITGSGDVRLKLDVDNLYAKVTGSGDMEIEGTTNDLEVGVTGSGDFDGDNLTASNTQVNVSGSGDASVYAKNNLKARVTGSGDISYKGNPENKDTKVSGSGSIDGN